MANEITLEEQAIIRALQKDLPLMPEPYKFLAQELKITEEELLTHIENLMAKKALKRISIALIMSVIRSIKWVCGLLPRIKLMKWVR